MRLVRAGGARLEQEQDKIVGERRVTIGAISAEYAGVFGSEYLAELHSDWPECLRSTPVS